MTTDTKTIINSVILTNEKLDLLTPNQTKPYDPEEMLEFDGLWWIGPGETMLGIEARTEFVPVLSRTLGALFIVGGRFGNTNTGEIWMATDDASPKLLEVPKYEPRSVMAATVGLADRMLWVLDEGLDPEAGVTVRLVRINLTTLEHELIWQGKRSGNFDKHWLSVDNDGQVLMTCSDHESLSHVVVKFSSVPYVKQSVRPVSLQFGKGYLPAPPMVDSDGYFFAAQGTKGEFVPVRVKNLDPAPQNWFDLGKCL